MCQHAERSRQLRVLRAWVRERICVRQWNLRIELPGRPDQLRRGVRRALERPLELRRMFARLPEQPDLHQRDLRLRDGHDALRWRERHVR
jgi:hypothetical protein